MEAVALAKPRVPDPVDTLSALSRRLQRSDRAAYAEVFRRFHGPLVRYARRITNDEAAAYDVLQDVFLKLWEERKTLTVRVSLKALLYTMVRNRALNSLRRSKWFSRDTSLEDASERQETLPGGEDVLAAEDLRRHLRRWIDALPARRAEAFVLSRYHSLKHSEIAAIMGVSERTVDTHILLALKDLRGRLDALQSEGTQP